MLVYWIGPISTRLDADVVQANTVMWDISPVALLYSTVRLGYLAAVAQYLVALWPCCLVALWPCHELGS